MSLCPCQSGSELTSCCQIILDDASRAGSALALMRARYTAYALQRMDFVYDSTHPDARADIDREAMEQWSRMAQWTGLEIIDAGHPDTREAQDEVEFKAHFLVQGVAQIHHERSQFRFDQQRWWFVDGQDIYSGPAEKPQPFVRGQKIGRNDPCPCGSGRKYKKCCAANTAD